LFKTVHKLHDRTAIGVKLVALEVEVVTTALPLASLHGDTSIHGLGGGVRHQELLNACSMFLMGVYSNSLDRDLRFVSGDQVGVVITQVD
jgi:hypothetical protein